MKIVLTGGGTGGHFYPLIAIAEEILSTAREERIFPPEIFYMGPNQYDKKALFDLGITFVSTPAGKMRTYRSILNVFDMFKTAIGIILAIFKMWSIFPDVVISKGGFASFPALVAAKFFRIPVIVHESDTVPGRVNIWAGKFARKIALSYQDAATFFPKDKTAVTGNPIRREVRKTLEFGAAEFLDLDTSIPTLLILGGSQGSKRINDTILDALPELIGSYQIIHQTGPGNIAEVESLSAAILKTPEERARYKPFATLDPLALRMAAGVSKLVISRAGSTIFEIALWGLPSIIIPIPESVSRDQTKNAWSYARNGGAVVIEEKNLTPHILIAEINRIIGNETIYKELSAAAKHFGREDAAILIAKEVLRIGLEHEA